MNVGIQLPLLGVYSLVSLVVAAKSPNPATLGNLVAVGGVGGSLVTATVAKNREGKLTATVRAQLEREMETERSTLSDRERDLYDRQREIEREREDIERERAQLEAERAQWLSTREGKWQQAEMDLEREYGDRMRQLDQRETALLNERERFEHERDRVLADVEREREIADRAAQETLHTAYQDLDRQRLEIEVQARQWVADALEPMHEEIATLQGENEGLKEQLAVATYPKLPRGRDRVEMELKELIPALYKLGFPLDYESHETTPNRDRIWLRPHRGFDLKELDKHSGYLQAILGSKHPLAWQWVEKGLLMLTISTAGVDTAPKTSKKTIADRIQSGDQWLIDVVRNCYHFRISGENGSGKSELFNNLYCVAKHSVFGGEVDLTLIDPKFPMSPWIIEDEPFIPQFKRWEEAPMGIQAMADLVEARIAKAQAEFKPSDWIEGISPEFKPSVWAIDETDTTMSRYQKEIKDNLRIGLKVGRALRVMVCYMCQSYLPSDLGLRHPDLQASAHILLSTCAEAGLEEMPGITKERKLEMKEEIALLTEDGCKYFALVKYPGKTPFIARLPKPKAYSHLGLNPVTTLSPVTEPVTDCTRLFPESVTQVNPIQGKGFRDSRHPSDPLSETPNGGVFLGTVTGDSTPNLDISSAELTRIKQLLNDGVKSQEKIIKRVWGLSKNNREGSPYREKVDIIKSVREKLGV